MANLTRHVQSFATAHANLNALEAEFAAREAELAASQNFYDLALQEKLKQLRAEAEAELTDRFAAVEAKEENVAEREAAIIEREKQCAFLLENVSKKTAEIVLAKEELFAERADGTLKAMINEFASLRHALDEKIIILVPSGQIDDAKKGGRKEEKEGKEGEKETAEGKAVVEYQEKSKKFDQLKLLASSTSAAATHKARASIAAIPQIDFDAALASTLEMMQSFELMKEGVTEIPSVQSIQSMPTEAAITQAAPAAPAKVPALTAPPATKKKATPPKAVPAKTSSKRPAPDSKEVDPAAECQKVQASLAAKASRLAEKKKEEEGKMKEAEGREAIRQTRMKKVEERTVSLKSVRNRRNLS